MRNAPLVLALAACAFCPVVTAAEEQAPLSLRVRLYDASKVAFTTIDDALGGATAILKDAGVTPEWMRCGVAPSVDGPDPCTIPLAAPELVVRVVRMKPGKPRTRVLPLGDAFVDTRARAGALATIYWDAVDSLARATGCSLTMLFGRAIAHEVGHLLLGTDGHSVRGIMRAVWTSDQVQENRPADWRFSSDDEARIRKAIEGRDLGVARSQ